MRFYGFLVFRFSVFMVLWFYGFRVLGGSGFTAVWFYGFSVFMVSWFMVFVFRIVLLRSGFMFLVV